MKNKGVIKAGTLRDDEIKTVLAEQRNALYDLRAQTVTEKVEDTSSFKKIRANIARALTETRARQIKAVGPKRAKRVEPVKPARQLVKRKDAAGATTAKAPKAASKSAPKAAPKAASKKK